MIADITLYPLELITTKVKISKEKKSIFSHIKGMYKKNKFKGLYRGVSASCYESMCSNIPFLIVYEYSLRKLEKLYK